LAALLLWLDELVGQHGEPGVDLLAQLLEFSLDFVEPAVTPTRHLLDRTA
jgi:hypothetical protein